MLHSQDKGIELDVTLGTVHFNRTYLDNLIPTRYNEFNPGLIVQYDFGRIKIGGGTFLNSFKEQSWVGSIGYDFSNKLSLNIGIMTGYENTEIKMYYLPQILLSYDLGFIKVGISPIFVLTSLNFEFRKNYFSK